MNSTSTYRRSLIPFALACLMLLSGCAGYVTLPYSGRFADVHEVFPDSASMALPADKRNAYGRALLQAPYAVVYRAVLASASEKMRIASNDKEQGVILATATAPSYRKRMYFFAIRMSEKGPKRTEVVIMAKSQVECQYTNPTGWANMSTLCLMTPFALREKRECESISQVHWLGDHESGFKVSLENRAELDDFMASVRAKVIKAGYE